MLTEKTDVKVFASLLSWFKGFRVVEVKRWAMGVLSQTEPRRQVVSVD